MIHFKNHKSGFTLIEVMLALMIVAFALTPVFSLLTTVMQRVRSSAVKYSWIVMAKNVLYEAHQKQDPTAQTFSLEKQEIDFDGMLTYSLEKEVNQKSSLKGLQGLHPEKVVISWTELGQKKRQQLVSFVYKKPEQKKS